MAKKLIECWDLLSFDEEELERLGYESTLEMLIGEVEDALSISPNGNGYLLSSKELIYVEKEWMIKHGIHKWSISGHVFDSIANSKLSNVQLFDQHNVLLTVRQCLLFPIKTLVF